MKAQAPETRGDLYEVVNCANCAAELKFAPGTTHLVCPYCNTENNILEDVVEIAEIDYEKFIRNQLEFEEKIEVHEVKCHSCGAETTFPPNVTSYECPYCNTSLILSSGTTSKLLKPRGILPFKVTEEEARKKFRAWLKGKWFLPADLKRSVRLDDKMKGMYLPYWTYDSQTHTSYTGLRGDNYTTVQPVTRVVNGKTVTQMQTVTKTRWTPVSGDVSVQFDDTLIVASTTLSVKYLDLLEPFDLRNMVPFDERYLAGFQTECYQVGVEEGFDRVKVKMGKIINGHIRRQIGGDLQQITSANTSFNDVTFKHVLLPIWINAYRYRKKVYRFLINGRTGEVHGDRPWDKWKVTITVLAVIFVFLLIFYLSTL